MHQMLVVYLSTLVDDHALHYIKTTVTLNIISFFIKDHLIDVTKKFCSTNLE